MHNKTFEKFATSSLFLCKKKNTAEGFLEKVKYSNKYKNSIIYLETFDSNKDSWKFNVNLDFLI